MASIFRTYLGVLLRKLGVVGTQSYAARGSVFKALTISMCILYLSANYTNEYRLVNGKDEYEGRFEVRPANGSWGSVLGSNWNFHVASIACQVLGHSPVVLFIDVASRFGVGSGPLYDAQPSLFECAWSLESFRDCDWYVLNNPNHRWKIGIRCLPCE